MLKATASGSRLSNKTLPSPLPGDEAETCWLAEASAIRLLDLENQVGRLTLALDN